MVAVPGVELHEPRRLDMIHRLGLPRRASEASKPPLQLLLQSLPSNMAATGAGLVFMASRRSQQMMPYRSLYLSGPGRKRTRPG
jgi:hypothetical protein